MEQCIWWQHTELHGYSCFRCCSGWRHTSTRTTPVDMFMKPPAGLSLVHGGWASGFSPVLVGPDRTRGAISCIFPPTPIHQFISHHSMSKERERNGMAPSKPERGCIGSAHHQELCMEVLTLSVEAISGYGKAGVSRPQVSLFLYN